MGWYSAITLMLQALFQHQVATLSTETNLKLFKLSQSELLSLVAPLQLIVDQLEVNSELSAGYLPFVLVIISHDTSTEQLFAQVKFQEKPGYIHMYPSEPADFTPISSITIPAAKAYLLTDIDRGEDTRNVAPASALETIEKLGRSPLTIHEGISILLQHPEFLEKNHCFSLLGSRSYDLRVPALWISQGRPKLGWCWNGNPHTWLGSASCRRRIAAS